MSQERRLFEREEARIPFIFSLDEVDSIGVGEWFEAETLDIGPVLVGGLAFISDMKLELNSPIRIALFMDLELRKTWQPENESFPVYKGTICRITPEENGINRVAVMFSGFGRKIEDLLETAELDD